MALRIGVIGAGGIGRTHSGCYKGDALAELVCICDKDQARADKLASDMGVKAYYSVSDMLRNEKLDAVSVCTAGVENGSHHCEPTLECLEAGVAVLCEKPLSNSVEEARAMVAKAREKKVYLGTNLNHRFTPAAAKAKSWVDEGKLGELLWCNMSLWINNPIESSEWFHIKALHPHSLDVMRYYMGPVKRVQAFFKRAGQRKNWSNASVNLEFASGAVGHLTGSYDASGHHPIERCELAGTGGRFILENVYQELTLYPRDSAEKTVITNSIMGGLTGFGDTFKHRIHRWLEQVTAKVGLDEIEGSGADGLAAQEIIDGAIESFKNGTVFEVKNG